MKLNHIFVSQTKTVASAAVLLVISALASRLLGLLRDRLLAGRFGAGQDLDIYFAAFRIPDFVFGIVIMSGLSAVFLPVFAEYFKKDEQEAWRLASVILNCFLFLLIAFCAVLAVFTPWLINFIAPGFDSQQKDMAVSLTRIMFLSPIFFGMSSIFSGVLHYFNRFLAYSIAPILYNLSIIFGILVFVPIFGLIGLAYGVILGAFLHWIFQIPSAKASGFHYFPIFNFKYPGLLKIFNLMMLRVIGASVYHINLLVVTAIASTLTAGSIAIFNFANNLQYIPIGVIGTSLALASFPVLSRSWADGLKKDFLNHFSSAFRQILFLTFPVSVLIFLLRNQIIRIILGTGHFGSQEISLTAAALGFFSLGIFAFALVPLLLRTFFSFQNMKTPTLIGLFYMIINLVFCISFVRLFAFSNIFQRFAVIAFKLQGIENISVVGLPLAVSASGIIYSSLLLFFLKKELGDVRLEEIFCSFGKIILSSVLMALIVYIVLGLSDNFVSAAGVLTGAFLQGALALLAGGAAYFLAAHFLRSPELKSAVSSILRRFSQK